MFDFTSKVKKVINEYAQQEAKSLGHEYLGPEHILLGLLRADDAVAVRIVTNLGVSLADLRQEILKRCEHDSVTLLIDPGSKDKVQKVLEYSREEATKLRHSYIGSEHILLAMLRDTGSIAATSLGAFSITYQVIRNELNQTLGINQPALGTTVRGKVKPNKEPSKTPLLDEFARNLSKMANEKLIDPVIGRDEEMQRVIQILSRKTKNNPILVGEAGVGKTAIVEGLAQRIIEKRVPETLFDKMIFALDVASLIAGTKYRGEFEDRIKKIMKEIQNNPEVILFIDEVHTIIGAGAAEGAVDAANILKPALARGELQTIGATTLKEYKKYMERDSALERRFQMVIVDEPSIEDSIRILSGLRKSYEKHHKVKYSKESIVAAVRMADRFISDRFLPDKAIDILDEVGAKARMEMAIVPENIKEHEKEILDIKREKNDMVKSQAYEKAAQLRDEVRKVETEHQEMLEKWREGQKKKQVIITEEDVAQIVSSSTGIPLQQLHESESEKLMNLEDELKERVVGQEEAIQKISKAVRRSRTGFKSKNRPVGTFMFLGPTGVGKTELVKALTEAMFGDEDDLIRFDMSEYMEMHSVSKFIGSPPGYVGYEEGGQLTEAVRRKPYSVILFDEIEKAHHDIQNILLQLLDEGELTDTMGHHVDFKETIIIMTSNLGARNLLKGGKVGFAGNGDAKNNGKKDQVLDELKNHFSPEFLNRIDDIIVFDILTKKEVKEIVAISIDEMNHNVIEKDLFITLTKGAVDYLAAKGYDEKYGARPLKRLLQKEIEDELATFVIEKKINEPTEVAIGVKEKKLTFKFSTLSEEKLRELKHEYLIEENSLEAIWKETDFDDETVDHEQPESLLL